MKHIFHTFILAVAALLLSCGIVSAQTSTINTVTEPFTGKTLAHPGDWELGNIAYFGTSVPYLTTLASSDPDRDGFGWLRLTENALYQSGYIRYKGTPIASDGLTIYAAFDFCHWDSGGGESPTYSADGTSFFIYDADDINSFSIGGYGGSLGYAPRSETKDAGVNGAASDMKAMALNSSTIQVYWNDNSLLEEGFYLDISTTAGFTAATTTRLTLARNSTSHIFQGLNASTTYYFRVVAYGTQLAAVNSSATSNYASASAMTTAVGTTSGGSIPITLSVYAKQDNDGIDTITLRLAGSDVATWNLSAGMNTFTYNAPSNFSMSDIRVYFTPASTNNYYHYAYLYYVQVSGGTQYKANNCTTNTAAASYVYVNDPVGEGWPIRTTYTGYMNQAGYVDYSTLKNDAHSSSVNPSFSIATPPPAPTSLTAAALATEPSVKLDWTFSGTPCTGFEIQYSAGDLGGWSTLYTTSSTTLRTYTATGLAYGTTYKFRVRALNGTSYSAASNEASATTVAGSGGTLVVVRALGTSGNESITLQVGSLSGTTFTVSNSYTMAISSLFADYFFYVPSTVTNSMVRINYPTDSGSVLIDHVVIDGVTYEAENCSFNSGAPTISVYGASHGSYSEWMPNTGYIDFATWELTTPLDVLGGLSGGYLGIGIDDWGNYSNPTEGRTGGPGYTHETGPVIAVRGDEAGNFIYLVGTGDANVPDLEKRVNFPQATARPTLSPDLRRLSIIVTPKNQLTVFIKYGTGKVEAIFTADLSTQVRPENIAFGFASSTGGTSAFHDIRNVVVTTFKSLPWVNAKTLVGPGDLNWNTDENWLTGRTPANSTPPYQDVEFDNSVRRDRGALPVGKNDDATSADYGRDQENVCLDGPVSIHTITISAPYPSSTLANDGIIYRFYGRDLTLNSTTEGASINANAGRHYVDCNIIAQEEFNFNAVWDKPVSVPAVLTIRGDVDNGGNRLRLTGLGTVNLISDTGKLLHGAGGLRIEDAGTFNFSGTVSNSYSGVNTMQEGSAYLLIQGIIDIDERSDGRSTQEDVTSTAPGDKHPYIYHDAMGTGPIVVYSIDSFTSNTSSNGSNNMDGLNSDGTSTESVRRASRIFLNHHNQIENNADVELAGGELHLNGFNESGDDPQ